MSENLRRYFFLTHPVYIDLLEGLKVNVQRNWTSIQWYRSLRRREKRTFLKELTTVTGMQTADGISLVCSVGIR